MRKRGGQGGGQSPNPSHKKYIQFSENKQLQKRIKQF